MNADNEKYDGLLFDADNHYYEAEDAFTRYVPKRMQKRCVEWVEMKDGKKFHLVAGKLNKPDVPIATIDWIEVQGKVAK